MNKARVIAFYLPQYHPIPENDEWWGKGFTEWTNVAKAKPLFWGHRQPNVPKDLGFYDLRVPETRKAQADMAREYGVEGFCYWHYWFAGRRIIERPFNEVLASGEPDFPFCLAWANQTWTGIWHGMSNKILIEQTYPGKEDYKAHFDAVLPAFKDPRYIKVDGKPLFALYCPYDIPDLEGYIEYWQTLAKDAGLPGIYFVGKGTAKYVPEDHGCDGSFCGNIIPESYTASFMGKVVNRLWYEGLRKRFAAIPRILKYKDVVRLSYVREPRHEDRFPVIVPNWDNTPRSGRNGTVFTGSAPELFEKQVREALSLVENRPDDKKIIFLKSWNEWAEGNYMEPDLRFGTAYLEALRRVVSC